MVNLLIMSTYISMIVRMTRNSMKAIKAVSENRLYSTRTSTNANAIVEISCNSEQTSSIYTKPSKYCFYYIVQGF